MNTIKIRYTWKRGSDGNIIQRIVALTSLEEKGLILDFSGYRLISRDLWTGWQDKNKNDIFCNDLISEKGSKELCQVIWQAHAGEWIMQSLGEGQGYRDMAYDYAQLDYEIKGNIHQPPTTRD